MIIQAERILEQKKFSFVLARFKFSSILYSVVIAVIVLLLDICFNKNAGNVDARKAEAIDAYKLLESARVQSPMEANVLESLKRILSKHHVRLPGLSGERAETQESTSSSFTTGTLGDQMLGDRYNSVEFQESDNIEFKHFNFDGGMDMDWNSLFTDLDSQFL